MFSSYKRLLVEKQSLQNFIITSMAPSVIFSIDLHVRVNEQKKNMFLTMYKCEIFSRMFKHKSPFVFDLIFIPYSSVSLCT